MSLSQVAELSQHCLTSGFVDGSTFAHNTEHRETAESDSLSVEYTGSIGPRRRCWQTNVQSPWSLTLTSLLALPSATFGIGSKLLPEPT